MQITDTFISQLRRRIFRRRQYIFKLRAREAYLSRRRRQQQLDASVAAVECRLALLRNQLLVYIRCVVLVYMGLDTTNCRRVETNRLLHALFTV